MLNFSSLLLFSENPSTLVEFYKKVFQKDPDWSGGEYHGFGVGQGMIMIGPHSEVHGKNTTPARLIFNFETENVQEEFDRIKMLGATEIAAPYHPGEEKEMTLATLADPDGNYFQLATPMSTK